MAHENQNFEIFAGNDKIISIIVYDDDGNLQPLTGCSAEWVMYDPYTNEILISKTTASGASIDIPTSVVSITLDESDTLNIRPAVWYEHELKITDAFDNETTVTKGYVRVKRSET